MSNIVVFRRVGSMTLLTGPDGGPPPPEACRVVETRLVYFHKSFEPSFLRGPAAYDRSTGKYSGYKQEKRHLFAYENGVPIFQWGFESRVWRECQAAGLEPQFLDCSPDHPRPDRYTFEPLRALERIDLRARQDECLMAIAANVYGQIHAPTGFGKGFIIAAQALSYPKARFAVVTYRKDVIGTLKRRLLEFLPAVGQVGDGQHTWERVTLVTADSMHHIPHDSQEPDFLLYDEGHEAPTAKRMAELSKFARARCFMFTGSPDCRSDGADFRLEGYFGPPVFTMTYPEAVALGLVLPIRVLMISVDVAHPLGSARDPNMDLTARERATVWRNSARNQVIARVINALPPDEQSLVLVKSAEHAAYLKQFLPDATLIYDTMKPAVYKAAVKAGVIDEAREPLMSARTRRRLTSEFEKGELKKAICTDVWSTGVSFDALGYLFRADARAAAGISIQAPGRTSRRFDSTGKAFGVCLDLNDKFDDGLYRRGKEREKIYRRMGWDVHRVTPEQAIQILTTGHWPQVPPPAVRPTSSPAVSGSTPEPDA